MTGYTGYNALADILSAFIQKRSLDGAYKKAEEFRKMADDMANPQAKVQPVTTQQGAFKNTAPKQIDFTSSLTTGQQGQQTAPTQTPAQGQQTAPIQNPAQGQQPAPIQNPAQAAGTDTTATPPQQPAPQQPKPKPFDPEFAAQQKLHPEWFVGNTYVGNDDNARREAYKQNYNPLAPNNQGRTPDQYADDAMKLYKFQRDKAEHPEWFVGDTYIGDKLTGDKVHDNAIRQVVAEHEAQQAKDKAPSPYPMDKNKGTQTEAPKPLSYDEYKSQLKSKRAEVMNLMVHKYGPDAAEKALKMIDDTIADKLDSYGDSILSKQEQKLNTKLIQFNKDGRPIGRADMSIPSNRAGFLTELNKLNMLAKRFNKPGYDMAIAGQLLSNDNIKTVTLDSGGNIQLIGTPANGGKFDNGSTLQVLGVIPKTLSPRDIQISKDKALDRQSKERMNRENNKIKLQAAQIGANARLRAARISAVARKSSAESGGSDWNSKAVSSRITDMITKDKGDGTPYTMPEIVSKLREAGMGDAQIRAYITPSVVQFYHDYQGDSAPDDDIYSDY